MNNSKVFIIAEAGVNHNGNITTALKLIDVAASAGANAIKFQTFIAENLVLKNSLKAEYQKKNHQDKETQFSMLKKLEFNKGMHIKCIERCKKRNIIFMSSAFDLQSLILLRQLNLKFIKIPSGEINNFQYLSFVAEQKKKVILSTGMSNLKEIKSAIELLINKGTKKSDIVLMQCTSAYPSPYLDLNLRAINLLKKKFNVEVGFSDHSLGVQASIAATALGAKYIEKHLTLNKNYKGPDHKASLDPDEFNYLVKSIRVVEDSMGKPIKKIYKSEKANVYIVRKSIVAACNIDKNEKFTINNLTCKRPAVGISPVLFYKLLGKKAKKNFRKDELIKI
jgi:N,N'-diacetyllegionaminate synthase